MTQIMVLIFLNFVTLFFWMFAGMVANDKEFLVSYVLLFLGAGSSSIGYWVVM